jgi:hypothetical protein
VKIFSRKKKVDPNAWNKPSVTVKAPGDYFYSRNKLCVVNSDGSTSEIERQTANV